MSTHVSHREIWYSGHVQGVGFRAQVLSLARGFDVTGYVQNLTDGRVYLHAEGDEKELDDFADEIIRSLDGHIRHVEERSFAGLRTTQSFAIKR